MSGKTIQNENIMGTEKVSRLVISTGIPLMLSLLINSMYNFVVSVFVSRVSEDALTALSLAAPVQVLVSAMGLGNAVGLNAAISKALGEKRPDKVRKAADAAIFIALCSWGFIAVLCVLFVKPYFIWQAGGSGLGNTAETLQELVPAAAVKDGKLLNGGLDAGELKKWAESFEN